MTTAYRNRKKTLKRIRKRAIRDGEELRRASNNLTTEERARLLKRGLEIAHGSGPQAATPT